MPAASQEEERQTSKMQEQAARDHGPSLTLENIKQHARLATACCILTPVRLLCKVRRMATQVRGGIDNAGAQMCDSSFDQF